MRLIQASAIAISPRAEPPPFKLVVVWFDRQAEFGAAFRVLVTIEYQGVVRELPQLRQSGVHLL